MNFDLKDLEDKQEAAGSKDSRYLYPKGNNGFLKGNNSHIISKNKINNNSNVNKNNNLQSTSKNTGTSSSPNPIDVCIDPKIKKKPPTPDKTGRPVTGPGGGATVGTNLYMDICVYNICEHMNLCKCVIMYINMFYSYIYSY